MTQTMFFVVLMWWNGGVLHQTISNEPLPEPVCKEIAKSDEATQRQRFGDATALCHPMPAKPAGVQGVPTLPRPNGDGRFNT